MNNINKNDDNKDNNDFTFYHKKKSDVNYPFNSVKFK